MMVLVMSAFSFLTLYPPASSGPWLRGVMAYQGRNRRLVRDCPTSIDAQMERKVQRVEGVMGVRSVLDKPLGSSLGTLAAVLVLLGTARSENAVKERMVRGAS